MIISTIILALAEAAFLAMLIHSLAQDRAPDHASIWHSPPARKPAVHRLPGVPPIISQNHLTAEHRARIQQAKARRALYATCDRAPLGWELRHD